MSVLPLKADIHQRGLRVRLVPEADIDTGATFTPRGLNDCNRGEAEALSSDPGLPAVKR